MSVQIQLDLIKEQLKETLEQYAHLKSKLNSFDACDYVSKESFIEYLNDSYDDYEVNGVTFSAGVIIERCEPIMFKEMFNDYCETIDCSTIKEYRELESEIDDLESKICDLEEEITELENYIQVVKTGGVV